MMHSGDIDLMQPLHVPFASRPLGVFNIKDAIKGTVRRHGSENVMSWAVTNRLV